jgi:two-component system chemotaxis sensor kinase CheA
MKREFVADACETLERMSRRLAGLQGDQPYPRQLVDSIFRTAHSLRGTAGMFGFDEVSLLAGSLENLLEALRTNRFEAGPEVARVVLEVLDHMPVLLRNEGDQAAQAQSLELAKTLEGLLRPPVSSAGKRPGPGSEQGARTMAAGAAAGAAAVTESAETARTGVPGPLLDPGAGASFGTPGKTTQGAAPSTLSVKVDIGVLDSIMNTISELFSTRLALSGIARRLPRSGDSRRLGDDLLKLSYLLSKRMLDLEASVIEARLVPMTMLFDRYSGEIRRLARKAGKSIGLVFDGEATKIDRAMLDNLYDPLLHVIRNAVDHGIESPEERTRLGKPASGKVVLRARQEASHIRIEVEDDGRGVDFGRVAEVASARGGAAGDRRHALDIIFEPGFTTKRTPNDISGRGVGLDAVKTQIEALRGMVNLATEPGRGTAVSIWVPLTLAVSRGILVEESGIPVAIPLGCIVEVLRATHALRREATKTGEIDYRGSSVTVTALSGMLRTTGESAPRFLVVLGIGEKRRAILVDQVCGETEIVSRPLPDAMRAPGFISGATELHDGRPAIVIEPAEVLRWESEAGAKGAGIVTPSPALTGDHPVSKTLRLVVLRQGSERYALPLGCLREMLPGTQVIEIPAIGGAWEGIFFVRGLCHGLLRLPGDRSTGEPSRMKTVTVTHPDRCGIRVDGAIGDCEIHREEINPAECEAAGGLIASAGTFKWMGQTVKLLTLPSAADPSIALAPGSGGAYAGLMPSR